MAGEYIQGHMAWEAYCEGRFGAAVDLINQHIARSPDDLTSRTFLADFLSCAGRFDEARQVYRDVIAADANAKKTIEHLVRSTAAATHDQIVNAQRLFEPDLLIDQCREYAPGAVDEISRVARELCAEWNLFRRDFAKRAEHYRRRLAFSNPLDLVLIIPPYLHFQSGWPPYGAGVLWDYLNRHGHACELADLNLTLWEASGDLAHFWNAENQYQWQEPYRYMTGIGLLLRPDLDVIAGLLANAPARALGFSCFQVTRSTVMALLPRIKRAEPQARIVIGGPDCFYPNQGIDRYGSVLDCIDAFVIGEGETATGELLNTIASGGDISSIKGVYVPSSDRASVQTFQRAAPVPAEDLAGFPKFDRAYIERIPEPRKRLIATNRGCVNRCDFCYDRKAWQRFRLRPPVDVVAEIRYNVEQFGIRSFHIVDSTTNASSKHLEQLCDLLIAADLKVNLLTSVMVSERMTPAIFEKMKRAGFTNLYFGIESGSTTVLNAMHKRGGAQWAGANLKMASDAGLRTHMFLIVGHPAEGEKEFQETLQFLKQNRDYISELSMVNPCHILQDTELTDNLAMRGITMPDGWQSFACWADGDNTMLERMCRKNELLKFAAEQGIPIAGVTEFYQRPHGRSLLRRALDKIRNALQ